MLIQSVADHDFAVAGDHVNGVFNRDALQCQVLGICTNGSAFGTYMSNCLSWEIGAS